MPDPNNLYLEEQNIVFQFICKAGNTSAKQNIVESLMPPSPEREEAIRNPAGFFPFIHKDEIPYDALVIGFQRHPVSRIVSCWKDKICGSFHQGFKKRHPGMFHQNMAFRPFLYKCLVIPDAEADQHFRSQSYDLALGRIDCMVRMEYIQEDWEEVRFLCQPYGLDLGPVLHKNGSGQKPSPLLGKEELDLIHTRWSTDFNLLGYT